MSKLTLSRLLLLIGSIFFLGSMGLTLSHIGDPHYQIHSWYHFFREATSNLILLAMVYLIYFGSTTWRTPTSWKILFVIFAAFFLPYWIGAPFNEALSAPHFRAVITHILQAGLMYSSLLIAHSEFK
ncbi:hypothetical protein [Photobacterium angustum]|uniref:Uncharacterized protein n=1 Tax=Photobacterium angustum TaxID=661 RepID=A0A2S7VKR6_PHOAN|nr:hypothetical protein [Photobacterium angustum]PQJ62744.1 hypothetical protein BTO08_21240 [Photobacterium angustum]